MAEKILRIVEMLISVVQRVMSIFNWRRDLKTLLEKI